MPADPCAFADFLATAGDAKHRAVAIDAMSKLAGVPSPTVSEEVSSLREGLRRAGRVRRGRARPIFPHELPEVGSPGTPPRHRRPGTPYIPGLTDSGQKRARDGVARHMQVLSGAGLRFDDPQEGQIGDVVLGPEGTHLLLFGSKTDRLLEGQAAATAASAAVNCATRALLAAIRLGLDRLRALPTVTRLALGQRFRAACTEREIGRGEPELANWPPDIRELASPLYAEGYPVHCLPLFGTWQYETLFATSDLRQEMGRRKFVAIAKSVLREAGVDATGVGAHSFRRGCATALFEGRAGPAVVSAALRHRNPRSTLAYVLESSRLHDLAGAMSAAIVGRGEGADARAAGALRAAEADLAARATGRGPASRNGPGVPRPPSVGAPGVPGMGPGPGHPLRLAGPLPGRAGDGGRALPVRPPSAGAHGGAGAAPAPGGGHAALRAGHRMDDAGLAPVHGPLAARGGIHRRPLAHPGASTQWEPRLPDPFIGS